ncbi:MAG: 30S ribosomal protein S4 [Puniceicoccales bacterium]|jgi:small subunit ribosomal protein S4|nr:30S ribosomal protein S4 [Puniceicoccales bacterium]
MSRYTGPRARINRRFAQSIFTPGNAEERKPYIPGMHGPRLHRKASEYAIGLNEKQKARYTYGMSEKQFRLAFNKAKNTKGVTGTLFLRSLELRLDSVVYNLGLAKSRAAARQFVTHGHILVNGKKVDIPSYLCSAGDIVEVANRAHSRQLAVNNIEMTRFRNAPMWLEFNSTLMKGTVNRLPERDEITKDINEQLIVEFYSR